MGDILQTEVNLREKSKFYDLEVQCNGVTFYVHRLIVCAQSEKLNADCQPKKGKPPKFIKDDLTTAAAMECMLQYFYTGGYNVSSAITANALNNQIPGRSTLTHNPPESPLMTHLRVCEAAVIYDTLELATLARERYEKAMEEDLAVDECFKVLKLIDQIDTFGSTGTPLYQTVLKKLVEKDEAWVNDQEAVKRIVQSVGYPSFNEVLLDALATSRLKEKAMKDECQLQMQANGLLQVDLDNALRDLDSATDWITELRGKNDTPQDQDDEGGIPLRASDPFGNKKNDALLQRVEDLEQQLMEESALARHWQGLHVEKDKQVQKFSKAAAKGCEECRNKNQIIGTKMTEIAKMQSDVQSNKICEGCKTRDRTLQARNEEIKQRDNAIQAKNEEIKQKDKSLQAKATGMKQKDQALKAKSEDLNKAKASNQKLENRCKQAEQALRKKSEDLVTAEESAKKWQTLYLQALHLSDTIAECDKCGTSFMASKLSTQGKKSKQCVVLSCVPCGHKHEKGK